MFWFEELTGFREENANQVRENCFLEGDHLISRVNGRSFRVGKFEIPSLADLRSRTPDETGEPNTLEEVIADVSRLHTKVESNGALFQVASQFNLLEMIGPGVTPERGVSIYEEDRTQGPACAIAAGGGTIFRNYFVPVPGTDQIGQTEDCQIDCLFDIGKALGNENGELWQMQNGYALPGGRGIAKINDHLAACSEEEELDRLRGLLRIGFHHDVGVTLDQSKNIVAQVYGSALPVSYSGIPAAQWEKFARLILEASYEATLRAAVLNAAATGKRDVYLTLLGGGAFGNDYHWIFDAIARALQVVKNRGLRVKIVSRGSSNPMVQQLIRNVAATVRE